MHRKKLSALKSDLSNLHDIEMSDAPTSDNLIFRHWLTGDILFIVKADDVYDADGNRFENDL